MKIAIFTDTFLPQINGVATSIAMLAKALGQQNHNVIIFAPKLHGIKRPGFKAKNVEVVSLPAVPAMVYSEFHLSLMGFPKAFTRLKKFNPDVIHIHTPLTIGFDALMAAKILKRPVVGTFHAYLTNPEYLGWIRNEVVLKLTSDVALKFCKTFFDMCDIRTAPSKTLINELHKNGFEKTIVHLPNSIDYKNNITVSQEKKEELKKQHGLKKNVIIHFGRLSFEKNIHHVIEAFSLITHKRNDVSLLIIGGGPEEEKLKKQVKLLKLKDVVVFTGIMGYKDLISSGIIEICDVFITASTMENQPMALLEAMNAGLPIIAVNAAGIPELVSNNGFLVQKGDIHQMAFFINKIINNKDLKKKLSIQSRKVVKQYSSDVIAKRALALYENCIR